MTAPGTDLKLIDAVIRQPFLHAVALLLVAQSVAMNGNTAHQDDAQRNDARAQRTVQDFAGGLSGVRAANPDVHLSVAQGGPAQGPRVLAVEYPAATADPAGRDVRCTAELTDWTGSRAIAFQINPEHAIRFSFSFIDRNGVVYSERRDLEAGKWQLVRIAFDQIRPNPYFQPPGAKTGAPLDVSEVRFVAFAPQDPAAGRLSIGAIVVTN